MLPRTLLYCTENVAGIHAYELSIQCWAIIGLPLTVSPIKKVKVGPLCQNIMPPHARIQEFSSRGGGGGGGSRSSDKKSSDNVCFFFFFFFFFVHSRSYRRQMVNFKEIYHFSRFQRGSNIFRGGGGGGPTFSRGGPIAYSL